MTSCRGNNRYWTEHLKPEIPKRERASAAAPHQILGPAISEAAEPAVLHPSRSDCRIRLAGLRRRLARTPGFRIYRSEFPKTPLLGPQPEIENPLRIDGSDRFTREVSGEETVSDFLCGVLRNAEDVPEARETGEPEIDR
jgi:hypothetical protein